MVHNLRADLLRSRSQGALGMKSGHAHSIDPTGGDGEEGRKAFSSHVQGKAVHSDPLAHSYADACNFAILHPYAGEARAPSSGHSVVGEGGDERFLQGAEVGMEILAVVSQVENGVAHQLARAVVGGLTAAVDLNDGMRKVNRFAKAALVASAANGVDGRMFEEEDCLSTAREHGSKVAFLKAKALLVVNIRTQPA